jgi:uncharacterized protein (TIGR03437 family)
LTGKEKHTHVKTFLAIVLTLGLLAASGFAQPTITSVQNAASNALSPLPNSPIAQGSYFAVYGTGFGPSTPVLWNPYPLPTTLGQTSASIVVGGTTVSAYIEFAANFGTYAQINAVLPSNTPTGTGTITVSYSGATSATYPITVVASSFGAFSVNEAGTGPGIITDTNYVVLTPWHTAKPGDYVILWGTGLGPAPDIATEGSAPPPSPPVSFCPGTYCPTVWVGGVSQPASIYYAGRSTYTAEDQVIFQIPASVTTGCYVQVAVQTGSVIGNFTSMAVDPKGGVCSDADGVNYNDISATVTKNGKANVGTVSLLSEYLNLSIAGLGSLKWDNDTVSGEVGTFSTGVLNEFQGFALAPTANNCTVTPFLQYPPPSDPGLASVTWLDAGSTGGTGANCGPLGCLSITGPNGTASVPTHKNSGGTYDSKGYSALVGGETIANLIAGCPSSSANNCAPFFLSASDVISAGTYTLTSPGGASVGAISTGISVPSSDASFSWTVPTGAIPRSSPLTITWTGGNPSGYVDITAVSSTLASGITPSATTPGILVECIAPTSAGSFTIPTYVLQSLPSTSSSTALVPPGELLVGPASVPVKATTLPSGLDALYIFYHLISGANVTWQ